MPCRILPAEWEPQGLLCVTWPHGDTDWSPCLSEIESTYRSLCETASRYQPVLILCQNEAHENYVRTQLEAHGITNQQLLFDCIPTNDTWIRDYGPVILTGTEGAVLCNFEFNAWGQQFDAALDNQVNVQLLQNSWFKHTTLLNIDFVLEGGNIDSNGNGRILCNYASLIHHLPGDKPDKHKVRNQLGQWLGAKEIHLIDVPGLGGDDTHGHIDTLCRFINEKTIVYCSCSDPDSTAFAPLAQLKIQLQDIARQFDYRLVAMPLPVMSTPGLPASYVNFIIINRAVLVPQFQHELDDKALSILQQNFPHHHIIGIDATVLIRESGALHCASVNIPRSVINENRIHTTSQ